METSDKTLINSVIRMLDTLTNDNSHYDTLIQVLALLCILSIVNRPQQSKISATTTASTTDNPIQKILGQLTKGEDANAPDMLMSLLPLLNNPQLKSKLNPANISSVLGLINNLGGGSEKASAKPDKAEKSKIEASPSITPLPQTHAPEPTAPLTANTDTPAAAAVDQGDTEKHASRSLNWKSNF
ncbi:MAG: hypothetical protein LLG02_17000 [Pelosinus sp.]|nr:hypothetical protein [Pelosinus sp.]